MTTDNQKLEETRQEFISQGKRTVRLAFKSLGFGVAVVDRLIRQIIAAMITFVIFSFLFFGTVEYVSEWNELIQSINKSAIQVEQPVIEQPTIESDVPVALTDKRDTYYM